MGQQADKVIHAVMGEDGEIQLAVIRQFERLTLSGANDDGSDCGRATGSFIERAFRMTISADRPAAISPCGNPMIDAGTCVASAGARHVDDREGECARPAGMYPACRDLALRCARKRRHAAACRRSRSPCGPGVADEPVESAGQGRAAANPINGTTRRDGFVPSIIDETTRL